MSCFSHQGVGWGGGEGVGSGILPTIVGYGMREPRKKKRHQIIGGRGFQNLHRNNTKLP